MVIKINFIQSTAHRSNSLRFLGRACSTYFLKISIKHFLNKILKMFEKYGFKYPKTKVPP